MLNSSTRPKPFGKRAFIYVMGQVGLRQSGVKGLRLSQAYNAPSPLPQRLYSARQPHWYLQSSAFCEKLPYESPLRKAIFSCSPHLARPKLHHAGGHDLSDDSRLFLESSYGSGGFVRRTLRRTRPFCGDTACAASACVISRSLAGFWPGFLCIQVFMGPVSYQAGALLPSCQTRRLKL